jgi:hypothetical protein
LIFGGITEPITMRDAEALPARPHETTAFARPGAARCGILKVNVARPPDDVAAPTRCVPDRYRIASEQRLPDATVAVSVADAP